MFGKTLFPSALAIVAVAPAAFAQSNAFNDAVVIGAVGFGQTGGLECVPYARQVSGIQIYGDAWTWWNQAAGRYQRGTMPRVGAVMAIRPFGNSTLGHVAAVSRIVDERTILIRHANWSPINGRRGQIEDNVKVVDVSPDNDWSAVRIWFAPIQGLGTTAWPVSGFIYPKAIRGAPDSLRKAELVAARPGKTITARRADPIADLIAGGLGD